jgi:polyisoprenoid-binding protein YceI
MRIALVAVLALATAPLLAQTPPSGPPGAPDPARVTAGTYALDARHSQVLFTVNHLGFTEYTGQFTAPTGTLVLDTATPANSKVDVTIPIDKVLTTVPALDAHLKTPDFFDAAKFPTAKFVSTKVTINGTTATIAGDLTLKDVTKPVVLTARFVGAGNATQGAKKLNFGFAATTSVKRSDFGINFALPGVSDKVDLTINAGFVAP